MFKITNDHVGHSNVRNKLHSNARGKNPIVTRHNRGSARADDFHQHLIRACANQLRQVHQVFSGCCVFAEKNNHMHHPCPEAFNLGPTE